MTTDNTNTFDGFESPDEIIAIVFDQTGAEGLKALMAMVVENNTMDRQHLLDAAQALDAAGLVEASAIVVGATESVVDDVSPDDSQNFERSRSGQPANPAG